MGRIGYEKTTFSVNASATSKSLFMVAAWFRGRMTLSRHKNPQGHLLLENPNSGVGGYKKVPELGLYIYISTQGIPECRGHSVTLRFG